MGQNCFENLPVLVIFPSLKVQRHMENLPVMLFRLWITLCSMGIFFLGQILITNNIYFLLDLKKTANLMATNLHALFTNIENYQ